MDEAQYLINQGYAITSRKFGILSRIDRPDWREAMALKHAPWDAAGEGMRWVRALGNGAADFYRRVYSRDKITVKGLEKQIPNSAFANYTYVAKEGDPKYTEASLTLKAKVSKDPDQWRSGFNDGVQFVKQKMSGFCDDYKAAIDFVNSLDGIYPETARK